MTYRKSIKKINKQGNMTLEAAIILPVAMLIIILMVKTSVEMHGVNKNIATRYIDNIEESINATGQKRKSLYKYRLIKDKIDNLME